MVSDSVVKSSLQWIYPKSSLILNQNAGNVFLVWSSQSGTHHYHLSARNQNSEEIDLGPIQDTNFIFNPFLRLGAGLWTLELKAKDANAYTIARDTTQIQVGSVNIKLQISGQNKSDHFFVNMRSLDGYPQQKLSVKWGANGAGTKYAETPYISDIIGGQASPTDSTGVSGVNKNMQPYLVALKIIKL